MTNPEQPIFLREFEQEANLLKACVRSIVYRLKTDVETLHAATKWSHEMYAKIGFISWDSCLEQVKMAESQLWYSVHRMKWLQGDGVTMSWIKVKEWTPQGMDYRWIRIDEPHHVRLIQKVLLPEECERQNLNIDEYHTCMSMNQQRRGWATHMSGTKYAVGGILL